MWDTSLQARKPSLLVSERAGRIRRAAAFVGRAALLAVTSTSVLAILFIFMFIVKDALPFFRLRGIGEFFTSTAWYPTANPPAFGSLAIIVGSGLVTMGAIAVAAPLGIVAAVCLSDILPFRLRQWSKPMIEILAAIPSVAFGFFALVVFAPLLQGHGGAILAGTWWAVAGPVGVVVAIAVGGGVGSVLPQRIGRMGTIGATVVVGLLMLPGFLHVGSRLGAIQVSSGANALNVSIILGLMAMPTVVSVSEDALQSVGRELREGAYALGATRLETMLWVVIPAAKTGICAAVILGVMRAIGETMVVWMASGNAAQIPRPWYDLLEPVRTLTATIAGDMGEADQVTGSARYHVLFAMALVLLAVSFLFNVLSERVVSRGPTRKGR